MGTRLSGTVALVTGASNGIGAATARSLAGEGAAVALLARRRDRLEELAAGIGADGGVALVVAADITDRQQAAEAVTRVARPGTAVYNLTKFGVNGFTEALRQEVREGVRVGVVEPGTVDTELSSHLRDGVREAIERQVDGLELLRPEDIADAVAYMVTRDRRVAVNEMLVRASDQSW